MTDFVQQVGDSGSSNKGNEKTKTCQFSGSNMASHLWLAGSKTT